METALGPVNLERDIAHAEGVIARLPVLMMGPERLETPGCRVFPTLQRIEAGGLPGHLLGGPTWAL